MAERLGRETLVITGSSRGGTSIPAYCMARAGIDLGDIACHPNHEDQEIVAAWRAETLDAVVQERNAQKERWGFKLPDAVSILPELEAMLRDPVFIITYRNPLAIGRTVVARDPGTPDSDAGIISGIRHGLNRMMLATKYAAEMTSPVILLDVDAAKRTPYIFVSELLETMKVTCDVESIAAEIAQPGYKRPLVA